MGSERSSSSVHNASRQFKRHLRLREGMFDNQPAESFHLPNYNALTDPVMGEYFDRGGRRRQGRGNVARHFIHTYVKPSCVELVGILFYQVLPARAWQMLPATSSTRVLNPRVLSETPS